MKQTIDKNAHMDNCIQKVLTMRYEREIALFAACKAIEEHIVSYPAFPICHMPEKDCHMEWTKVLSIIKAMAYEEHNLDEEKRDRKIHELLRAKLDYNEKTKQFTPKNPQ